MIECEIPFRHGNRTSNRISGFCSCINASEVLYLGINEEIMAQVPTFSQAVDRRDRQRRCMGGNLHL